MPSSIVRLLSIAAAFALGFLLVGVFLPGQGCNPWWYEARSYLNRLKREVEWAEIGREPLSVDEIEAWLSERASPELARRMEVDDPKKDPWGRPYRVVAIDDAEGADRFGFYSIGCDGASATAGNDPDDINSWNEATTLYYQRELRFYQLLIWLGLSAAVTPIVYQFAGLLCSLLEFVFGRATGKRCRQYGHSSCRFWQVRRKMRRRKEDADGTQA